MNTLANMLPQTLPKLRDWLPLPPPKLPIPKILAHKLGWNPGTVYWAQVEDSERWRGLVDTYGTWSARRAVSFAPRGDWETLEARAKNLYETVISRR